MKISREGGRIVVFTGDGAIKFLRYISRTRVQRPDSREQPRRNPKPYYTRVQIGYFYD
jgi:hypothetical protein